MNKIKLASLTLTFLIGIACSSWYFVNSLRNIKVTFNDKSLLSSIDATVTDLTVQQYDSDGVMINFLETPSMRHIPENNTHLLTTPHIIVHEKDKAPWEINALEAVALHGGEEVTFKRDVVLLQREHENTDATTLFTEEITYFPNTKIAVTQKDVRFQQANNSVRATGIKAYLAEGRVQLLSNARGHYEQKHG
jgi:lipopolysaccharide export system protein LptC